MKARSLGALVLCAFFFASFAAARAQGQTSATAATAAAAAVKAVEGQHVKPPADYASFIKGASVTDGLLPVIVKDGKVYLSVSPSQLNADFIETSVPSTGFGGAGPAPGEPYVAPARILHFQRYDDKIVMRWPNTDTLTVPQSPQAAGVAASLPSSILAVSPIVAEDSGHIVFSAETFLGDVADLADQLNGEVKKPGQQHHLDPTRSFFSAQKAFPENDVLRVTQTWVSSEPSAIDTAPDRRSITVEMTYNIIAAPHDGYVPRYNDQRVGYVQAPILNFSTDDLMERAQHYIVRWNFGTRTSGAPFHATNPLVFYLASDIPTEYRAPVRNALLNWNRAFEKVGILDAVRVEDQPASPGWDPDDIRHNMVRWIDTSYPQYGAEALVSQDPRTGEELNVGVNFDATEGIGGRLLYKYEIAPVRGLPDTAAAEAQFAKDLVYAVILHESGHDLGLLHNFIGSMAYTAKDLQSVAFTQKYGIGNSVMEYDPLNLWPKGTPNGDYEQMVLGPYDYYAVRYGYGYTGAQTPAAERATLDNWASQWANPRYRFASDDDAYGFANGASVDPRVEVYDLTNAPLPWCATQLTMLRGLMNGVDARFPQAGMPYDQARAAFLMPMRQYLRCAAMPANTIGGEYLSRSRKGDPGAVAPFTPVSRATERAAWLQLRDGLFSDAAWRFSPSVLNSLSYSQYEAFDDTPDWGYKPPDTRNVSVAAIVAGAQDATLKQLFAPMRLARLDQISMQFRKNQTMSLSDLFDWAQSGIFGNLASGARDGVVRRNLQVMYAKRLAAMWTNPLPGTPADAQALARLELQHLEHAAGMGAGRRGIDTLERAHLEALRAIASQALQAHATIGTPSGS